MHGTEKWQLLSVVLFTLLPFFIIFLILLSKKMSKVVFYVSIGLISALVGVLIKTVFIVKHSDLFKTFDMQIGALLESSFYYIFILAFITLIILVITSFKSTYSKEKSVKFVELCVVFTCVLLYLTCPIFICNSVLLSKFMPNTKFDIEFIMINKEFIPQLKGAMASETAKESRERIISYYNKNDKTYLELLPKSADLHEIAANYYDYCAEYYNLALMFYKVEKYDEALSVLDLIKSRKYNHNEVETLRNQVMSAMKDNTVEFSEPIVQIQNPEVNQQEF